MPKNIDPHAAAALGFPKLKYAAVERERRWLCREIPRARIMATEAISDLYVTGTRLRLREARPLGDGAPMRRLTRKADVGADTRLITSIYLPQNEFDLLAAALSGIRVRKLRHRLQGPADIVMAVDEFQDALAGLVLAEAEFETPEAMAAFAMPDFALHEVTDDPRFTGAALALNGRPAA